MRQLINTGSAPNDGTGTPLRTAMGMINDNFSELYNRQSPYKGQLYDWLKDVIKGLIITDLQPKQFLYVSKFEINKPVDGDYVSCVEISTTQDPIEEGGAVVLRWEHTGNTPITGARDEWLSLEGSDMTGRILIDYDAAQSELIASNAWFDTAIEPSGITSERYGWTAYSILASDDETILDGSKRLYVFDVSDASITVALPHMSDLRAPVKILVIDVDASENFLTITPQSSEKINGLTGVTIHVDANKDVTIIPDTDGYYVLGNYTIVTPSP